MFVLVFSLVDNMTSVQKYFSVGKYYNISLLVWLVLTVMFTHANLATNVNPDLGPLFVSKKVVHLGIFDYPALVNYDYNMSGYVKITLTCNYRNIFP